MEAIQTQKSIREQFIEKLEAGERLKFVYEIHGGREILEIEKLTSNNYCLTVNEAYFFSYKITKQTVYLRRNFLGEEVKLKIKFENITELVEPKEEQTQTEPQTIANFNPFNPSLVGIIGNYKGNSNYIAIIPYLKYCTHLFKKEDKKADEWLTFYCRSAKSINSIETLKAAKAPESNKYKRLRFQLRGCFFEYEVSPEEDKEEMFYTVQEIAYYKFDTRKSKTREPQLEKTANSSPIESHREQFFDKIDFSIDLALDDEYTAFLFPGENKAFFQNSRLSTLKNTNYKAQAAA